MTAEEMIMVVNAVNPLANRFGVPVIGSVITAKPTILHPAMLALNAENPKRAEAVLLVVIEGMVAVKIGMAEAVIDMGVVAVEAMATEGTIVAAVTAEAVVEVIAMVAVTVTEVVVTVTEVVATVTEAVVTVMVVVAVIVMAAVVIVTGVVAVIVMAVVAVAVVMVIALLVLLLSSGLVIGTAIAARAIISLPKLPAFVAKHLSLKQAAVLSN